MEWTPPNLLTHPLVSLYLLHPPKFADPLSLAPTARQKTVWEHYNKISRYIDFERECEWGDIADLALVFVSKYILHIQ